jgi:hypothetical protein
MRYTIHVNLSGKVASLTEARERLAQLADELPALFRVVSFSVWSPDDGIARPLSAAPAQAVPDEQLLAELRQIAGGTAAFSAPGESG